MSRGHNVHCTLHVIYDIQEIEHVKPAQSHISASIPMTNGFRVMLVRLKQCSARCFKLYLSSRHMITTKLQVFHKMEHVEQAWHYIRTGGPKLTEACTWCYQVWVGGILSICQDFPRAFRPNLHTKSVAKLTRSSAINNLLQSHISSHQSHTQHSMTIACRSLISGHNRSLVCDSGPQNPPAHGGARDPQQRGSSWNNIKQP